ncbi:MAG TPA: thiamine pyrophosphate-dependent enzyme [Nitrososphaerales archaeon]|nr:thiamine pyrophosphate-dependent enzyme [Nitrososphaerales archaeon]
MGSPRILKESDLGYDSIEDIVFRRLAPDGVIDGEKPDTALLRRMYSALVLGRTFDEKASNLSTLREIGTYAPCEGQEGAQVGFTLALEKGDWYVPMYRDSAGMIAFGLPPMQLLQFWGGDERGMKMPPDLNLLPVAVPVATQIPHAVGLAMSEKAQGMRSATLVSTGDGGTSKGDFHEGLNFAGVYKLPVIFAVENNQWAISLRREEQTASGTLAQKAIAYGFEGIVVDGNDVLASYEATRYAVERARRGDGPTLIELLTYRVGPHTTAELVSNKLKEAEEIAEWEQKDPLHRLELYLRNSGLMNEGERKAVADGAQKIVSDAVNEYRNSTGEAPSEIFRYMYDLPTPALREEEAEALGVVEEAEPQPEERRPQGGKQGVNIRNALNMALRQEMKRNDKVVVFGEDVGKNGGVFQVTRGLQEEFGKERVFDTPLAESCIAGIFVGLAIGGMVPVAEFQFDGFTPPAFDQIFGHIARMRNRTRGRFLNAGVIRFPYGAGTRPPEQHSDSPEAYFSHTPGLKVVVPSNPYEAKGLLASALREPNPVVFMEPKRLYDSPKGEVPEEEYTIPIGKARAVREGTDVTLVAYGSMMVPTMQAADALQSESGISAEVLDLRTISPLDSEAILASVRKTGRLIVVHEAPRSFGVGAEIAALVADKGLDYLRAPVKRVTGFDIVVPLGKKEDLYIPSKERITKAAAELAAY